MMSRDAAPGSPYAVAIGCTCPVVDNAGGKGCGQFDEQGEPLFWVSDFCPLHSPGLLLIGTIEKALDGDDDE
jgi:hypothetical protein